MSDELKPCPFGCLCSQDCMLSVWICNSGNQPYQAACALAVLAVKGTVDNGVNTIPLREERK